MGFIPSTPEKAAGWRIEPPVSVPSVRAAMPAATAAAAPPEDPPDAARFARGRTLTQRHPCGVCHNPDFSGREQMPRLANQREEYLLRAMREYKSGARLGYGGAMSQELAGLSDQDLIHLAHFLAHQGAKP